MLRITVSFALALAACSPPPPTTEQIEPAELTAEAPLVVVTSPRANARVTSPILVEGAAPGDWFFEAQFPAELRDAGGAVLAEARVLAQGETITEAPAPFRAQLSFTVSEVTHATLVLREEMPSGLPGQREISIPIVLIPAN